MEIKETVVHHTFEKELLVDHVLEPGDCCWLLNMRAENPQAAEPLGWGVVVKSARNDDKRVEVRVDTEPIRLYARDHLRWLGPMD